MMPGPTTNWAYVIATPKGMAYARGRQQALTLAREMVGAPHTMRGPALERQFRVYIERISDEHARRHWI